MVKGLQSFQEDLRSTGRQARALEQAAHRPWPLPKSPWLHAQTWRDVIFLHYSLPPETLRAAVSPTIPLDLREGRAWLSLVAFEVRAMHPRLLPPPPILHRFLEVNARTYSTIQGKPGVVFLSLDATSLPTVAIGRLLYHLPYFYARMSRRRDGGGVALWGRRTHPGAPSPRIGLQYSPYGEPAASQEGSLEHWLVERYCLYTLDPCGALCRAEIHHAPWPLQGARVLVNETPVPPSEGLRERTPDLVHFAGRQDVTLWPLEAVRPA